LAVDVAATTTAIALPPAAATTVTGWPLAAPSVAAASPKIPKSTLPLTSASFPSGGESKAMTW
jgi:hypothetical protein